MLRLGGAVLIVFLCFATLFIIINTIRLTVFARRREVVIMKYVGATDWFIRWPFMLEGMTLGLGGGIIACAIVDLIYVSLSGRLHTTFAFFPILQSWPTLLYADLFIFTVLLAVWLFLLNMLPALAATEMEKQQKELDKAQHNVQVAEENKDKAKLKVAAAKESLGEIVAKLMPN